MASYASVLGQDIWRASEDHAEVSREKRVRLAYKRAKSICEKAAMSVKDVDELSDRFFDAHKTGWTVHDTAVFTILTIHWNLCMGTIALFARERADVQTLLEDLRQFRVCGEFMLTEVGHGLDARNLETAATLQADGSFDLHTPSPDAAKAMPPSTPWGEIPRVAVVFARLIVEGIDRGIKPFLVRLCEADQMCPGVTSRALPTRVGARPLDHAITSFNHVRLEPSALLGTVKEARDPRREFLSQIWRVSVGTLTISLSNVAMLRNCAYIAWKFSQDRLVSKDSAGGGQISTLQFSTQFRPILAAAVQAAVFDAYGTETASLFRDQTLGFEVRHALATIFKATIIEAAQPIVGELADRCGWRGLFAFNQIAENMMAQRGNSVAEGDVLVLCIRLASEVLLGRYQIPPARDPDCLLAQHERRVWAEVRETAAQVAGTQARSTAFNHHILPRCRALVVATGQRMAYEAAKASNDISPEVLALYQSTCVMAEPGYYCENGERMSDLFARHVHAVEAALPQLPSLLEAGDARSWVAAPISDRSRWEEFVNGLPAFRNDSQSETKCRL
ncbi:acyl-CoA dehydrogenase NM domain-like protein [Thozetella sp. PMI_491]|nr:acyl-CoA dehydrogenase NM domain-like protein [Thozetella sp. PMI_491]